MSDLDDLKQSAAQDDYDERVRPHLAREEEEIPADNDDEPFDDIPEYGFDYEDPYSFFFGPDE